MSSDGSESDGSDIKIQSALLKPTNKKIPDSPTHYILKKQENNKKLSTKIMIVQALIDLKSRKGVSLHAIKKYITEKYNVNTEKLNYYIKKYLKSAVEKGTIIQTKGVGASGSFKLVPVKETKPKAKKPKKEKTEKTIDPEKKKAVKDKSKKIEGKSLKSKVKSKESKEDKPVMAKKKMNTEKMPKDKKPKEKKDGGEKVKKVKIAKKDIKTPLKKKGMMKRKSIGSIIKQPKMRPSAKA